jgi:hypothetical protein
MGLFALLLIAFTGWLIWSGRLQRMTAKDGMALGLAIVGAVLAAKGKPLIGALPMIASAAYLAWASRRGLRSAPKPQSTPKSGINRPVSAVDESVTEAAALLGVSSDADAKTIRAAHRRLIASVHPDRGGTEALAARINAARDTLLRYSEVTKGSRHGVNAHSPNQGQDDR